MMSSEVPVWEMEPLETAVPARGQSVPYTRISMGHREKCPVCGKIFTMHCRRDEWGFWYNSSIDQLEGHLTLLCSPECAKAFERLALIKDARELMKTKAYQVMKLYAAGLTSTQISKALGLSASTVTGALVDVRDFHWREWDYIQKHGENLTA